MIVSDATIGKLYRYYNSYISLGMTEQQYLSSFIVTLIRIERMMKYPIKTVTGLDIPHIKENDIVLLLDINEQHFAGDLYKIFKVLINDQILYFSLSNKKTWQDYFHRL